MKCIIPLAGPDIYSDSDFIKPLVKAEGEYMIQKVLNSRPWLQDGSMTHMDLIFVIRDHPLMEQLKQTLQSTFKLCRIIVIDHLTQGALFTCMAALSVIQDVEELICIDLADIVISGERVNMANYDGMIPYFKSSEDCYSYILFDSNNRVTCTREKIKISTNATAGIYFFKNIKILLEAIIGALHGEKEIYTCNDIYFIAPVYNYLVAKGYHINAIEVEEIYSFSKEVHR